MLSIIYKVNKSAKTGGFDEKEFLILAYSNGMCYEFKKPRPANWLHPKIAHRAI